MSWYSTGTVSVTNGSTAVTGTDTLWATQISAGDALYIDGLLYEILTVGGNTSLQLRTAYAGTSGSNRTYKIIRFFTNAGVGDLALRVTQLTARYEGALDTALSGRFASGNAGAPGVAASGDPDTGVYWPASNALAIGTGGAERLRVTSSGLVGIGTSAPGANVDIVAGAGVANVQVRAVDTTQRSEISFAEASGASIAAFCSWRCSTNPTFPSEFRVGTVGPWPVAVVTGNVRRIYVAADGKVGISNSAPTQALDVIGTIKGYSYIFGSDQWSTTMSASDLVWRIGLSGSVSVVFRAAGDTSGYSTAAHALSVSKSGVTNRSINAAGTVNVTGADYAEYERKAPGCGPVAKGDVIGIDAAGLITDRWADAIHFAVKSTDPSFVGGDTWTGNLDPQPLAPTRGEEEADADWSARMAAWEASMVAWEQDAEAERVKWDRVAYAGKVPVNLPEGVTAAAGDWLVPAPGPDGGIIATVVADAAITFGQYRRAVGRVRLIGGDGRPVITIKAA